MRRFAVLLCCVLVLAGGCRSLVDRDTLVIAVESAPRSLDPRLGSVDSISARLHQILFDTLVRKNDRFEYVPHLAESFRQNAEATLFTFQLRQGVRFHDGREFTSSDVKYTFDSIRDPALKSPVAGAFSRLGTIDTPDRYTVVFHATEPYPALLGDLVAIGVIADRSGDSQQVPPLGTGPFRFVAASEQRVELQANDDYFLGAPRVRALRVRVVPDNNTRELELKAGYIDLAINSGFLPDTVAAMRADPDVQVVVAPGTNIAYIGLNTTDEVLSNRLVRQALAYGIDREQIIDTLMRGTARLADGVMPPESWAYAADVQTYGYDPARARALLDAGGFPDPDGNGPAPRLSLTFTTSNVGLSPAIAQIVQEQWRRIGVEVTTEQFERQTFFDRLNKGSFDVFFNTGVGWNQTPDAFAWIYYGKSADPALDTLVKQIRAAETPESASGEVAAFLAILARGSFCPVTRLDELIGKAAGADASERRDIVLAAYDLLTARGGGNRSRYCSREMNDLILRAEQATTKEEQSALFADIQRTAAIDVPLAPLWYQGNVLVARGRVGNLAIDPSGSWYFLREVTLE